MGALELLLGSLVVVYTIVCPSAANYWALNLAVVANNLGEESICDPSTLTAVQESICTVNRDVVYTIAQGVGVGLEQCQLRFATRRWNCSVAGPHYSYFVTAAGRDTPEAAYVQAITSAGMMSLISRKCKKQLLQKCSCDSTPKTNPADRSFFWGDCGDNFDYGYTFSKQFSAGAVEVPAAELSTSELMLQHNTEAGRLIVQNNLRVVCRCHGLTGSCNVKTCSIALPDFTDVGTILLSRYESAVKVEKSSASGELVSVDSRKPSPEDDDLVFVTEPPSYCNEDVSVGSLGTVGRECKVGSSGVDSCDVMCCGRGYQVERVVTTTECNCKFHYCCYTTCENCTTVEYKNFCM